jgi:hypothetical protein
MKKKIYMKILNNRSLILLVLIFMVGNVSFAYINPKQAKVKKTTTEINFREDCTPPKAQVDQNVNNVRARLTSGGDVWWDQEDGKYVVPIPAPGEPEVSSLFAGAVWIGGRDNAGNLKLAATTYRDGNNLDFYSGPLLDQGGITDLEMCLDWDRFFKVEGVNIDKHIRNFKKAVAADEEYECDSIPDDVKYWPGRGNEFFNEKFDFELPDNVQGLGSFHDEDEDGKYEPCDGDYPIIEIRGCPDDVYPDEMFFWIYNDNGGPHTQSLGSPIQMEVQVQAFAFATNDEINDMTFQRYKLINRAIDDIRDCYFAMWVDPDLGCYTDDYVGSVPEKDLMFVYNQDKLDGSDGCTCEQGVNTYCDRIPILGVDYFRGPLAPRNFDEFGNPDITPQIGEEGDTIIELGMTSLIYYNNVGVGTHPNATTDPNFAAEYYNYLQGLWKDGTAITYGGSGYNLGSTDSIKYVFPDPPSEPNGWSMYTEQLGFGDRRTIQATGPFLLKPGAINELIIGVPWVPNQFYPAPDLDELLVADDLAQTLFDNCFEIQDGPDAPDVDIVELDRELVLVLSNDTLISNNAFEQYQEKGLKISEDLTDDINYVFEGYQVYQLASANVTVQELDDFEKARLIYQVDLKNDVTRLYNWDVMSNPSPNGGSEKIFTPELKVNGANDGIRHIFFVKEDQFASGNRRLVNHKPYYFIALAYGYNNWSEFNPTTSEGQREPYFAGRKNIQTYTGVPRPLPYTNLNVEVGNGVPIVRLDGAGVSTNFVDLQEGEHERILSGEGLEDSLRYVAGMGPVNVTVFNPMGIRNKKYRLELYDEDLTDDELSETARWQLTDLSNNKVFLADTSIDINNEQIIYGEGFAVKVSQVAAPGTLDDDSNGVIGSTQDYKDPSGADWLWVIRDDSGLIIADLNAQRTVDATNFLKTGETELDQKYDPTKAYSNIGEAPFIPFWLADFQTGAYVTPGYKYDKGHDIVRKINGNNFDKLYERDGRLNNVDIVFTADKDKWSRCVVVESCSGDDEYFFGNVKGTEGGVNQFDLRAAPSVGKEDADGDGFADEDGDGTGMGWFPGYAIDVETGQRVNIFFGENSVYGGAPVIDSLFENNRGVGRDMIFNPTNDIVVDYPEPGALPTTLWNVALGGQHFVYVMNTPYDECAELRTILEDPKKTKKAQQLKYVTWAGVVMARPETSLLSYAEGLIPNEATVKIRVANPYSVQAFTGENNGHGAYLFNLNGLEADPIETGNENGPLDMVNVAPNPYYAYSPYETSQFTQRVKITNLPGECTVTIFSLDGKFIRQFKRDEEGIDYKAAGRSNPPIAQGQIYPDIEWDLKNSRGIPVSSGVYLIHIVSEDLNAERTIKWFGINRKFDPTGL